MKGPLDRTKVVLRHLPPTITQSNLVEQVDARFSGRYRWLTFRPGKSSLKHPIHSRAYIDFNKPEDVYEFADSFNNHVFVNEKGTQFKVIVEYAPSQRVPKQWSKKDGREGTLLKDPDYLEFLEIIAKPIENLPSAEIQLERKEAERAGAPKDAPVITPLMDYVRQKRAAKSGARRPVLSGKPTRRVGSISARMRDSTSSKRPVGKKNPATMYVLRENSKGSKDKSINSLAQKDDSQQLKDKSINLKVVSRIDALEGGIGGSESAETGKKKILLLKGKGKESNVSTGSATPQDARNNPHTSAPPKQPPRREPNGRVIKSILINRDNRPNQSSSTPEQRIHSSNQDNDNRPPRPPGVRSFQRDTNGALEDKGVNNTSHTDRVERRTRNKDRPDRGVWTPLRRSDGPYASDESLSSSASQTSQLADPTEDMKPDVVATQSGEHKVSVVGRGGHYSDNGYHSRRGSSYSNIKDTDGSPVSEGKSTKRGGSGYGSSEKQIWVQKSGAGS